MRNISLILPLVVACSIASGQDNPVYVDDSPIAWELFREAQDQTAANTGEAARIYQELLDEFALRLIPADRTLMDRFAAVRRLVLAEILRNEEVLQRHRIMEDAEARRLLAASELQRLVLTRPWTAPGLDALLMVAQRQVESACFDSASDLLDMARSHPDIAADPGQSAHAWYMTGVIAHYTEYPARLAQARHALAEAPRGQALLDELDRLIAAGPGPVIREGLTPLDQASTRNLDELVSEEIWSVPLPETIYSRRFDESRAQTRRGMQQMGEQGMLLAVAPTIAGDAVYVNQGHHILALDRFTGSPLWLQPFADRPSVTIIDREDDHARDMNIVVVEHDALVTLTGYAHATQRSSDGSVLCLDANTGELRWSTRLDRIGPSDEYDGLFPYGAPIVAEGRVFVLARRVSAQSLTSTYLIALDLADGSMIWTRHVASSGSIRRAARAFSTPVYRDGSVYLVSPIGAMASIDARTGETRWLRRFAVSLNPTMAEQTGRPWELGGPIVTSEHVLALVSGVQGHVVILDRHTGHEIQVIDASLRDGWNSPSYLLAAGQWVYAVGREVRAFHMSDLHVPVWALSWSPDGAEVSTEPLGRVHIVGGAAPGEVSQEAPELIVPVASGVLIVDGENGQVRNHLDVVPGNVVAADAQLFVASNDRLESYMSMTQAVKMLDERISASPADPEPAMSLLRLAVRVGNLDLALAAASSARRAIGRSESPQRASEAQRALFSVLLELEPHRLTDSVTEGEAVFELLRNVVEQPDQMLAYLLAYGSWLEAHDPRRAVNAYQAVLSDDEIFSQYRLEGELLRPGWAWAINHLQRLVKQHGPAVYQQHAQHARDRLNQAIAGERRSALLLAIADEFPLCEAALDAVEQVASEQAATGNYHAAAAALMRLYRRLAVASDIDAYEPDWRAESVAFDESSLSSSDEATDADQAAQRLLRAYEDVREAARWSDAGSHNVRVMQGTYDGTLQPRIGQQQGEARVLPGRVLAVSNFDSVAGPSGSAIMVEDSYLRRVDSRTGGLHEQWTIEIVGSDPKVLHIDEQRVLIWFAGEVNDPRASLIDAQDGSHIWTTPRIDEFLDDAMQARRLRRSTGIQMPSGEIFNPRHTIPLADASTLIMAHRFGVVTAFDLDDGHTPLWTVDSGLDQIHIAHMRDGMLVLAGLERTSSLPGRNPDLSPAMIVLDVRSGRFLHGRSPLRPFGRSGVTWMSLAPLGMMLCATDSGLEAWDLHSGELAWANVSAAARSANQGWSRGDHAVIQTATGELASLAVGDGRVSQRFGLPQDLAVAEGTELRGLIIDDEGATACYGLRVMRFDRSGAVIGMDVVRDERNYRWLLPAADRVVLVSALRPRQQLIPGEGARTHHGYRIYCLSEDGRLLDEGIQLPALYEPLRHSALIDGWLLLVSDRQTIAVPFPVEN